MRHDPSIPASSSVAVGAAGFAGLVVSTVNLVCPSARDRGISLVLSGGVGGGAAGGLVFRVRGLLPWGLVERLAERGPEPVRRDADLFAGVLAVCVHERGH